MSELRKAAEAVLEAWGWDWSEPRNEALRERMEALRQALAQDSLRKLAEIDRELGLFDAPKQPEKEPETVMAKYEFQTYAAYKDGGEMKIGVVPEHTAWVTAGEHTVPLETAAPVDTVNISQQRVDETAKREHEPYGYVWTSLRDGMEVRFSRMPPNKFYSPQDIKPVYTAPPKRKWVGLTDEEVDECYYWKDRLWTTDELVRHVEAKLKEKNSV